MAPMYGTDDGSKWARDERLLGLTELREGVGVVVEGSMLNMAKLVTVIVAVIVSVTSSVTSSATATVSSSAATTTTMATPATVHLSLDVGAVFRTGVVRKVRGG